METTHWACLHLSESNLHGVMLVHCDVVCMCGAWGLCRAVASCKRLPVTKALALFAYPLCLLGRPA